MRFVDRDGKNYDVKAPIGSNLLEVAHREDIDLEGACEGSLACSTCHVIVDEQAYFDRLPEADDDENDMLDLAFGLTETCAACLLLLTCFQCGGGRALLRHAPALSPAHGRVGNRASGGAQVALGVPDHCGEGARRARGENT